LGGGGGWGGGGGGGRGPSLRGGGVSRAWGGGGRRTKRGEPQVVSRMCGRLGIPSKTKALRKNGGVLEDVQRRNPEHERQKQQKENLRRNNSGNGTQRGGFVQLWGWGKLGRE